MNKKGWLCGFVLTCRLAAVHAMEHDASIARSSIDVSTLVYEDDSLIQVNSPYSAVDFAYIYDQIFEASDKDHYEQKNTFFESCIQYIATYVLSKYFELEEFAQDIKVKVQKIIAVIKTRLRYETQRRKA